MQVAFTTNEAPGAERNGTIMEKTRSCPGDTHRDGAKCVVLGSIDTPIPGVVGYFVEWEDTPGVPVFVASIRLTPRTS